MPAVWVHCNNCSVRPIHARKRPNGLRYFLTNCGHTYCDVCISNSCHNPCKICNKSANIMEIDNRMDDETQKLFSDYKSLSQQYGRQLWDQTRKMSELTEQVQAICVEQAQKLKEESGIVAKVFGFQERQTKRLVDTLNDQMKILVRKIGDMEQSHVNEKRSFEEEIVKLRKRVEELSAERDRLVLTRADQCLTPNSNRSGQNFNRSKDGSAQRIRTPSTGGGAVSRDKNPFLATPYGGPRAANQAQGLAGDFLQNVRPEVETPVLWTSNASKIMTASAIGHQEMITTSTTKIGAWPTRNNLTPGGAADRLSNSRTRASAFNVCPFGSRNLNQRRK